MHGIGHLLGHFNRLHRCLDSLRHRLPNELKAAAAAYLQRLLLLLMLFLLLVGKCDLIQRE